jgi:hypothetical protein
MVGEREGYALPLGNSDGIDPDLTKGGPVDKRDSKRMSGSAFDSTLRGRSALVVSTESPVVLTKNSCLVLRGLRR